MNVLKKIIGFFIESYGELKKVNWPSRDDVISQTIMVVVSLAVVAFTLAVIDFFSGQAIIRIITLGR